MVNGEVVLDSVTGKRQQKVRLTPEELEAANAAAETDEVASAETDITETSADANTLTATLVTYGNAANGNNGNSGNGNGNQDKPTGSDVKKTSTVVKQFVVDFSSETYKPLMEHEVNGLNYRYVYSDKARLSVVVQGIENGSASLLDDAGELHAYYHCDYLGTTDYLTSAVNSKVISWTSYSEWGEITHNAVLKCGQRELDLVKEYATHDFDAVLNMYYAKARFYDADNRRFAAVDPILNPAEYSISNYVSDPMMLVQYLYVRNNSINWIDRDGYWTVAIGPTAAAAFGLSISASAQLIFDDKKNVALIFSGAAGAGTPNLSGGGVLTFTSADTVHDLSGRGVSLNAGGSAGLVVAAGVEFMTGSDRNGKTIYGASFSVGVGPIPAELHANLYSGSYVTPSINLPWLYNRLYNYVRDYYNRLDCTTKTALSTKMGMAF